jgi:putative chitinase
VNGKAKKIRAKKETIANKAYVGRNGNSKKIADGDGWKYRGRGLKQLTGKGNYSDFSINYDEYFGGNVDFVANPSLVAQLPYAVHSAIWFWLNNRCYEDADKGINGAAIDAVTKKINSGESDKNKSYRRQFVKLAYNAFV